MTALPPVSDDTLTWWGRLPQVVQELDAAQPITPLQPYGYPLLCWMEGIGSQLQALDSIGRDQGTVPGFASLLTLDECPDDALPWLAQFVGLRFTTAQLGNGAAAQRLAIATPGNWSRGTPAAIAAAAAPYLIPPGQVTIIERTPDPYSFTVEVPLAYLNGISYAELAAGGISGLPASPTYAEVLSTFPTYANFPLVEGDITAALEAAKPAGLVMTIDFV